MKGERSSPLRPSDMFVYWADTVYKSKASDSAVLIIRLSIAVPQCQLLIGIGEGTDCKAIRTSSHCLSEASLRANVPSNRLRTASCVLRFGVRGVQGDFPPALLFFCRRFFSKTEKKCRNAGSVKYLIRVGREGRGLKTSNSKSLNFRRRTKFATTGCDINRLV